jgi:regulator of sigma E protease
MLRIDGRDMPTFADVQVAAAMAVPGERMSIAIDRSGHHLTLEATIEVDPMTNMPSLGISPAGSATIVSDPKVNPVLKRALQSLGDGFTPEAAWTLVALGPAQGTKEPVERWGQLEAAAKRTNGADFTWWWESPDGVSHHGVVRAKPQWQPLRYADATSQTLVGVELGLGGLVPVVEIERVIVGGANDGTLEAGDLVLAFNGIVAPRMRAFRDIVKRHGAGDAPMTIERSGKVLEVLVHIVDEGLFESSPQLGVFPAYAWNADRLAQPMTEVGMPGPVGTPAIIATPVADLGIAPGATFSVPGRTELSPWRALWIAIQDAIERGHDEVQLTIDDGTGPREVMIPLDATWTAQLAQLHWQSPLGPYVFDSLQVTRSSGGDPIEAVQMGLHETWNFVVLTYVTIDRLFRGTVGVEQLHGPVGIVHLGTRIADKGVAYMLFFLALISVNLAVLNFLPLPIVDGGLMLYLVYEKFKGRPPSIGFQNGAALVGLLLIGSLFLVTFYNDILRLVG